MENVFFVNRANNHFFIVVIACLFFSFSACSKEIFLEKKITVDISKHLESGVCKSCIYPVASDKNAEEFLYFAIHRKNELLRYNVLESKFSNQIDIAVDSFNNVLPFYVDKGENIFGFARQKMLLVKIGQNKKTYQMSGIFEKDSFNTGYLTLSSYVTKKGIVYLNQLRLHNAITASTYFSIMRKMPAVGVFEINGNSIFHHPVQFVNPYPDDKSWRLANSYILFDVDEKRHLVYFQNRCVDTIFVVDENNGKVKNIVPYGSRYNIIPQWYNPDSTEMEDILLSQNMVGAFFVDSKREIIYRQISVKHEGSSRFALQLFNTKGKFLAETLLDENIGGLNRYGDEILIFKRIEDKIEFYKIVLK